MTNLFVPQVLPSSEPISSEPISSGGRRSGAGGLVDWRSGLELLWPVSCAGCGRPDVPICVSCRSVVAGPAFATPVPGWPLGFEAWAACGYRGPAAHLLIAWKERGRVDLTEPLGVGLGAAVRACRAAVQGAPRSPWLLVPVPTTRAARRHRGTDLMAEVTRRAASTCRVGWEGPPPRPVQALAHRRRVRDQGALGAVDRRANLRGALVVRRNLVALVAGQNCVVVDDIVTTGTTAAEAARALTAAGARVVGACFLSVTLRRRGVPDGG